MNPAYLYFNTYEFQSPKLEFAGLEIVDIGEGTGAITEDGLLQAGELVKVKIVVQNRGQNISKGTKYKISSNDRNIYITGGSGDLGDMGIGEVKDFWVTISPNKRVDSQGELPIYLTVENSYNKGNLSRYRLPVKLDQKPPEIVTLDVEADIEKLKKQVARFEINSNKITANIGSIIDIQQVPLL
jgi:hypothetical protein